MPITDFKSFIAYIKEHQKAMNYGSAGIRSSGHMVCHFMNQLIGVEVQQIPYRASGQALTALLAGDVDYVCDAPGAITEQIASRNVRRVRSVRAPARHRYFAGSSDRNFLICAVTNTYSALASFAGPPARWPR